MTRQVDIKALISHIVRGDGGDKCRICMGDTTEGQVYLGDTIMIDGEKPVTLAELLESITGVTMNEDIIYPQGVCVSCTTSTLAAREFSQLVRESRSFWTRAVIALDSLPTSIKSGTKSISLFVQGEHFSTHIVEDYTVENNQTALNILKRRLRKKKPRSKKKQRVPRSGPPCVCPDCGKNFISPHHLSLHLKNSGQKDTCLTCGVVLFRGEQMKEHLISVHGEKVFTCTECPSLFLKENELKQHKKKAHAAGALTCSDCGRTFPRSSSFDAHSQMHAVRICRECGKQFTNRGCYREHRSICEPNAKPNVQNVPLNKRSNIRDPAQFICDYCSKSYTSRAQLKNHILWIHMDMRPHQCSWCGKRFYTPARLAEHSVVHTRERNFECDICGAKLVSKMAAVYHRRRHTGEKPYKCEDCGATFLSSSRRSEHAKRRHGRGQRYHCSDCPASYVRGHELKKHVDKVHSKNNAAYSINIQSVHSIADNLKK